MHVERSLHEDEYVLTNVSTVNHSEWLFRCVSFDQMEHDHRPRCGAAHAKLLVITVIAGDNSTDQDPELPPGSRGRLEQLTVC
jgi:hypothetical protein